MRIKQMIIDNSLSTEDEKQNSPNFLTCLQE